MSLFDTATTSMFYTVSEIWQVLIESRKFFLAAPLQMTRCIFIEIFGCRKLDSLYGTTTELIA